MAARASPVTRRLLGAGALLFRLLERFVELAQYLCRRDLLACLNSQRTKLYHTGIRGKISRSTLADANKRRDWRLFKALGHRLIATAVEVHQGEDIGLGLKEPLYALDSTTIDLYLTLFPWADFRSTKAAVKAHTIVDLRGAIPVFVHITTGKVHDVNVLDLIHWPAARLFRCRYKRWPAATITTMAASSAHGASRWNVAAKALSSFNSRAHRLMAT